MAKSTLGRISFKVKSPLFGLNVERKNFFDAAINTNEVFKTVTGSYVAPAGAVTVKLVAEAADTAALVAPNFTILLAAVVLKLVPVIVTVVPGTVVPEEGLMLVIVGIVVSTQISSPQEFKLPPSPLARSSIVKTQLPDGFSPLNNARLPLGI